MSWQNEMQIGSLSFTCGHCGNVVASAQGFYSREISSRKIYICPHCKQPTYFNGSGQLPGVAPGNAVNGLPPDVAALYTEARNCIAASAHTSAVLTSRKLLINIAVSQGASEGESFIKYVEFLSANGYVPPKGKGWVDHIRKKGNEANHEIVLMKQADAEELVSFLEMLLKFIYEFPSRVPST